MLNKLNTYLSYGRQRYAAIRSLQSFLSAMQATINLNCLASIAVKQKRLQICSSERLKSIF